MKKTLCIILLIFMTLFAGCNTNSDNKQVVETANTNGYPQKITDTYKREITLPKEPSRVISLAPNITEIIFSLGKQEKLVGRTDYCDYPESVNNIPSVGTMKEPNIEKIAQLNPDLIIASTHFQKETLKKLEDLKINTVVFYGEENFEGAYETIRNVGNILGAKEKAEQIVLEMEEKVKDVTQRVKGKGQPSVYYVVSYGNYGDYTAGKDTFIGKMIEMAGGKNAADDAKGWKYSIEKLVEKNPDILICSKYFDSLNGIKNTTGYKELKAVKEGKLFEIDNNQLDRQGTRLADGLVDLAKIIHPEAF